MSNAPNQGAVTVSNNADYQTALAAGYAPEKITIAAPDLAQVTAEAIAEHEKGVPARLDAARAEGATTERTRVTALLTTAGIKPESRLAVAVSEGKSAESMALAMVEDARSKGVSLESIARDATSVAHANPGKEGPTAAKSWDEINKSANAPRRM